MNTYRGRGQGQGPQQFRGHGCRTSTIMLKHTSINITHMTRNRNSMAHHVVCVEDLTILPSTVIRVNTILTTLWKR